MNTETARSAQRSPQRMGIRAISGINASGYGGTLRMLYTGLKLLVAASGVCASASDNQPWAVRAWQSDAGLPDNTVVGIEQTPDGFLWVATKTGLVRFDGVQFREFPILAEGVQAGIIKVLAVDQRGRLWVALGRRTVVCLVSGQPATVFNLERGRPDMGTGRMVVDGEGSVWVSYIGGEVFRIQDGRVRLFTAEDGLSEAGNTELAVDVGGHLWFARANWVGIFRDARFHPLSQLPVTRITATRSGGVWVYTRAQLLKCTEGGTPVKFGTPPEALARASPTVIHEDSAGRLLIGTSEAGLFSFDGTNFTTVATSHQTILSIKEDREGNIWVGTRGGGLNQIRPRVAELMATGSGSSFEAVRSVCQDTDGMLWAVVWQKGAVMRYAGQGWSPLSVADGWDVGNAQCVAADPQGGVWIGTEYTGLYHWLNGVVTERLCTTNALSSNRINALLMTASGDFWIGSGLPEEQQQALQRRRDGQFRTFNLPSGSGPVIALATDTAGDCWAVTGGGLLLRVRGDVLSDETEHISAGALRCLLATPDGSVWIGTGGQGLGRLKDGRFSRCQKIHGLHDDYISNMLPDGQGRLWLAGNKGIFSLRLKELDDFAEGRTARVRSVVYRQKDGLPGLQASFDAWPGALRSADGRLLFAMQTGVAAVYPETLQENPDPPPAVIEGVNVDGKTVAAYGVIGVETEQKPEQLELSRSGAHLRIPPGRRQVEFHFTALSLIKSENIEFKYQLHGLDADWVDAGMRRTVTYSQLPPGRYRFEVTACNSDGIWHKTGSSLDLTAEPYWWETAWFRLVAPLSTFGLLGSLVIVWLRRRHRNEIERLELLQATEKERVRIAADLHDNLGADLTQIGLLSEKVRRHLDNPDEARQQLDNVFAATHELSRQLDAAVWAVGPANDTLESLVQHLCKYVQEVLVLANIRCRLAAPAEMPPMALSSALRNHVFLSVKEALHNVIKHAEATLVTLRVLLQPGVLVVEIEDDGRGIPEEKRSTGQDGLSNIHARMAQTGGRCEMVSGTSGKGTLVRLILPLDGRTQL